jgi:hypothetical protein
MIARFGGGWFMSRLFALSIAVLSTAAVAQPNVPRSDPKPTHADPERIVCQRQVDINSRLNSRRVCMTEAQWAEYRRATRQWSESVQSPRPD